MVDSAVLAHVRAMRRIREVRAGLSGEVVISSSTPGTTDTLEQSHLADEAHGPIVALKLDEGPVCRASGMPPAGERR